MKKHLWLISMILIFAMMTTACGNEPVSETEPGKTIEITVSAAASLTDALTEMKAQYEKENPTIVLTFNFASSGKLAQQIEQGAPVDVYISANQKYMDQLEEKNFINSNTRKDITANKLVLITNKENTSNVTSFEELSSSTVNQISIGDPESVPAGKYAKEALTSLQLWDSLQDQLVLAKDVRQVLAYAESGNVDFGIVYSSDALISDKVKVVAEAKSEWHKAIVYPGAVLASTNHPDAAQSFLDYLSSEAGKGTLRKYGFQ